ncbi:MAG TPA: hypothetical protein VE398_00890 [Acidobacteriota bacterium]|nr:hypothetical protein [Acidobacteriota bacterium]
MNSRELTCVTGIFLLLMIIRIPALIGPANLSQDATEYIDIARNVADGDGLVLKIRAYFLGDGYTLPYPSASLRSPLFPYLMGKTYAMLRSPGVFRWFNLGMFFLNMVLLVLILRRVLPFQLMAYSLLLIGLSEPMFLTSIFPWAEQTAFFWLLLALLLAGIELHRRWGWAGATFEGFTSAMAGLSRPEYMLVSILFLAWLALRERRVLWVGAFLVGCLTPGIIVSALNFHDYGRIFLPGDYLFRSRHYSSYFSWEITASAGAGGFVVSNWIWIVQRILHNAVNYIAKLIGWKDLFALVLALPLVLRNAVQSPESWRKQLLTFVPLAFFCAYCAIWAGIDRERYLLAVTTFLLPLCVDEVHRWSRAARRPWVRIACLGILVANLPLLLGYTVAADFKLLHRKTVGERFYASENPAWSNPDLAQLADWIRSNVGPNEVTCLENPFLVNYQTGRLTLLLPERTKREEFLKFLRYYSVRYWVNNKVLTKYRPADLAGLERVVQESGAREVARCGTFQVWRIP